jgi:hypothetical protein
MPAYARKTTIDEEFGTRRAPDNSILCGRCNQNLADPANNPTGTVYIVYTDKNHLKTNRPYEVYGEDFLKSGFPRAKIV